MGNRASAAYSVQFWTKSATEAVTSEFHLEWIQIIGLLSGHNI